MSLAWIAVLALGLAVGLSIVTKVNVGVVSMGMAWLIGVYLGGMSVGEVLDGFPTTLLVTLVGVTLLFSIAQTNGTLEKLTSGAVGLSGGRVFGLPFLLFGVGLLLSTIGPGATPASALLAPPAMVIAHRAGISPFLMAIMVGNGTLGGTLSPLAPTGIVASGVMDRIGLGGVEWQTYAYNAIAHAVVGIGGFLLFGGMKLVRERRAAGGIIPTGSEPLGRIQWLTLAAIAVFVLAVSFLDAHVGLTGFAISAVLLLAGAADQKEAIQRIPWGVIVMVTGVTVLVGVLEAAQGMELITSGIARVSTSGTLAPIVAFGAGIVSVYSSTSGVVLPAFLPMVPDLSATVGNVDPLDVAWSMNVGASLVDLSSLSTVGALFLAAAPEGTDTRSLFNKMLAWGLGMSVVGSLLCWVFFAV